MTIEGDRDIRLPERPERAKVFGPGWLTSHPWVLQFARSEVQGGFLPRRDKLRRGHPM